MQIKGTLSTVISAAHNLSLSILIITAKCTKAEDRDVIEEDVSGKLCLRHRREMHPFN